MPTTVTIESVAGSNYRHEIKARSHVAFTDAPLTMKGGDTAPTPHEYMLAGLGACTAMTLEMLANRQGWKLTGVTVTVTEDLADDPDEPGKKIPRITEKVTLSGDLSEDQVARLTATVEKCPVYKVLMGKKIVSATVEHEQAPARTTSKQAQGNSQDK